MAVQEQVRESGVAQAPPPLRHIYLAPDDVGPQLGDRAFCGHVRRETSPARLHTSALPNHCVVCLDLVEAWKAMR